jgi:hypothetical protein
MACRASVAADSASALCLRWESTASAAASYWQAGKQSRRTPRDRSCGSRFRASLPTCPTFKRTKLDYSIVAHTVAWPNGVAKSESGRPRPRASRVGPRSRLDRIEHGSAIDLYDRRTPREHRRRPAHRGNTCHHPHGDSVRHRPRARVERHVANPTPRIPRPLRRQPVATETPPPAESDPCRPSPQGPAHELATSRVWSCSARRSSARCTARRMTDRTIGAARRSLRGIFCQAYSKTMWVPPSGSSVSV